MRAGDLDDDRAVYRYAVTSKVVHLKRGCCSHIAESDSYEMRAGRVNPDTPVCSFCGPDDASADSGKQQKLANLRRALRSADPEEPDPERLGRPSAEAARGPDT